MNEISDCVVEYTYLLAKWSPCLMKKEEILEIPALHVLRPDGRILLDTPGIVLEKGNIYAISGPSGAGKTLFLNQLFFGKKIFSPQNGQFYMLQEPGGGLTPHLKIRAHFSDLSLIKEEPAKEIQAFMNRYPASLSGGERQRVMASLVLVRNPDLLICDEPTANLSQESARHLFETLLAAQKERLFTLLFVTHQWQWIQEFANYLLFFRKGMLVFKGAVSEMGDLAEYRVWLDSRAIREDPLDLVPGNTAGLKKNQPAKIETPPANIDSKQKKLCRLEIRDFSLKLGERRLFQHFNWSSQGKPWWWVQGANGCGKSTLAKVLAGLINPDAGALFLDGIEIPFEIGARLQDGGSAVQYAFQLGVHLFNPKVDMGKQLAPFFRGKGDRLLEYMDSAGLESDLLTQKPGTLSLGEKQRFNLIRALARQPRFLIADEILASLDHFSQVQVVNFLEQIQARNSMVVMVISHDRDLPAMHAGEVLSL